jgi:predicted nucleotidyltransferase component of viral defense system
MIPLAYLKEWQQKAPWTRDELVEQDLIISRVLVDLFNQPHIADSFAFRGGTAFYKLFIQTLVRYSEDIDLVQIRSEPIGDSINKIRAILDPLLGKPKRYFSDGLVTLIYKLLFENQTTGKLKIEINTREHFSVFNFYEKEFSVESRWFSGNTKIKTYQLNELMGTKLRALYQRKKGRDFFDLWMALQHTHFNPQKTVEAFQHYMKNDNTIITRAMFEMNLSEKIQSGLFFKCSQK